MRLRMTTMIFFALCFLVIDYYVFQAVQIVSADWAPLWRNIFRIGFWVPTGLSMLALLWWTFGDMYMMTASTRSLILTGLMAIYLSKIFAVFFLLIDDIVRAGRWVARYFNKGSSGDTVGQAIPRSEFLAKTALVAASIPLGTMVYGVVSGAHDYRVRRQVVKLPNLPKAFDGMTIGQLSDIHSGSFFNKTAVRGGVEMMLREKPDVIFFTGDLVNNESKEVNEYLDVFNKLRAPLGVYSVTGNHDYGDYHQWETLKAKHDNFKGLIEAHRLLGFDLLMNQNRFLEVDGEKIAVLGIENWGAGRFSKYGQIDQAYRGTEEAPVKLLLSHDPSHWDAQVRTMYPDIDMAFAGHTHGFQFGVEIGKIKWSPSQYVYKQWAGLYQEGSQYLYVNRGFGYLGYPGRVGMPPELTIIELKRA